MRLRKAKPHFRLSSGSKTIAKSLVGATFVVAELLGCGGSSATTPMVEPPPPPERTAADSEVIRSLMLSVAEQRLCEQMTGQYVTLPDTDSESGPAGGASPAGGRLKIQGCRAERRENRLAMHLEGPGWTWVEQTSAGPAGSSFTVRGFLHFETEIDLEGEIDLAFSEDSGIVSLWLTPTREADAVAAAIRPTGAVPVEPDGGWSRFLGAVGGVFGDSVEERARPMVEEQGGQMLQEKLAGGFTFTVDLCRGQTDSMMGPLENGQVPVRPYPPDGTAWLANQRSRLRAGGLDVAGPFRTSDAPLRVELEVESGPGLELRTYCTAHGNPLVEQYIRDGEVPETLPAALTTQRITGGETTFVDVDTRDCAVLLVGTPIGNTPTVYRYRVQERGARAEALIRCE